MAVVVLLILILAEARAVHSLAAGAYRAASDGKAALIQVQDEVDDLEHR